MQLVTHVYKQIIRCNLKVGYADKNTNSTEDISGELSEANVAAPLLLTVIKNFRHEEIAVKCDGCSNGEGKETQGPTHAAEGVRQGEDSRSNYCSRQMKPSVLPCP